MALIGLGACLLTAGPIVAQTPEIEKQIQRKLDEARKEKKALDDLLAQALRNNADVRVAEAKLREAEAELYRVRMTVLTRIAVLQNEIKSRKAAADEAAIRVQNTRRLHSQNIVSAAELSAALANEMKYKSDLAVVEAELDGLLGKHANKAIVSSPSNGSGIIIYDLLKRSDDVAAPREAQGNPTPVQPAMAEKILKALGTSVKIDFNAGSVDGGAVIDLLRQYTKGVNIQDNIAREVTVKAGLKESIPLGALYEWAEDHFHWRFVIRDYGIVVTDGVAVPPAGAQLLLDFWRKSKNTDSGAP
jgi:hypothetical protein